MDYVIIDNAYKNECAFVLEADVNDNVYCTSALFECMLTDQFNIYATKYGSCARAYLEMRNVISVKKAYALTVDGVEELLNALQPSCAFSTSSFKTILTHIRNYVNEYGNESQKLHLNDIINAEYIAERLK